MRKATGKSTTALIQGIRFRRARALLENSRLSVEQVAEAVGYRDATALRKLMRKITGASPRQNHNVPQLLRDAMVSRSSF